MAAATSVCPRAAKGRTMSDFTQADHDEPRWAPVLAILGVFAFLEVLPHHVYALPRWISYAVLVAAIVPMVLVTLSSDNAVWLRVEHVAIMLLASVYALTRLMPDWGAALTVALTMGIIAAFTVSAGMKGWKKIHPTPDKTIENVKENVEWVKQQIK